MSNTNPYEKLTELIRKSPNLFGVNGVFGGIDQDHQNLQIFMRYARKEKLMQGADYTTLTSVGFTAFMAKEMPDSPDKVKELAAHFEFLQGKELDDTPSSTNTFYQFASALEELGITADLSHGEALNAYNSALRISVASDPSLQKMTTPEGASSSYQSVAPAQTSDAVGQNQSMSQTPQNTKSDEGKIHVEQSSQTEIQQGDQQAEITEPAANHAPAPSSAPAPENTPVPEKAEEEANEANNEAPHETPKVQESKAADQQSKLPAPPEDSDTEMSMPHSGSRGPKELEVEHKRNFSVQETMPVGQEKERIAGQAKGAKMRSVAGPNGSTLRKKADPKKKGPKRTNEEQLAQQQQQQNQEMEEEARMAQLAQAQQASNNAGSNRAGSIGKSAGRNLAKKVLGGGTAAGGTFGGVAWAAQPPVATAATFLSDLSIQSNEIIHTILNILF
jgi:hypothetical protein